jgi:two-component system, NarL family, invasion response regulator UvrY
VVRGGTYVSPSFAEHLAAALGGRLPVARHEALSDREHEVLRLIGAGRTGGEIAAELALSAKTVSTYRTRILRKLGLRTSADLIRYALQHELTQ